MKIQTYYNFSNALFFNARQRVCQQTKSPLVSAQRNDNKHVNLNLYNSEPNRVDINKRTYDSFTGMRDKQYLLAQLSDMISESVKNKKKLSIAMFDMDNFKSVNEFLGYEVGDIFIKSISNDIDIITQKYGLSPYRFGGEEFFIIFNKENKDKQKVIVDEILKSVNSNSYINCMKDDYKKKAEDKLSLYTTSVDKLDALFDLKEKKEIYNDLHKNLTTDIAKEDPYLLKSIKDTEDELNSLYSILIFETAKFEDDDDKKMFLYKMENKCRNNILINEDEQLKLDEYLRYKYDKTAELFQAKKWLSDFNRNNGFSITGSAVTFTPETLVNKRPMDLIDIAGETLKRGKEFQKGKHYHS